MLACNVVAFNAILARVILHGAKLAGINVEKATVSAHWGGCHQRGMLHWSGPWNDEIAGSKVCDWFSDCTPIRSHANT